MKSHLVAHLLSHLLSHLNSHLNSHLSCHCQSSVATVAKLQTKALYRERVYDHSRAVVGSACRQGPLTMSESESKSGIDARLEAIESNLKFVGGQQRNILSALSMILDTLRAQGKMLQQLTTLAREEPASSPLVQSLDEIGRAH